MQTTSPNYKAILQGDFDVNSCIQINSSAEVKAYDTTEALISASESASGKVYFKDMIKEFSTMGDSFPDRFPSVGNCMARTLKITLIMPDTPIPRRARLVPYCNISNSTNSSEWLPKGVYYIDTRPKSKLGQSVVLTITGYDVIMKLEQMYKLTDVPLVGDYLVDEDIADKIAQTIGTSLNADTQNLLKAHKFKISKDTPLTDYTYREIMSYIAMAYCGNWISDDFGKLKLIQLNSGGET